MVTAEDVARAWLRVERSKDAGISADRIRARRATAVKLTRQWGSEQRKGVDTTVFTQQKVVTGKTKNNGNIHGTTHKAA